MTDTRSLEGTDVPVVSLNLNDSTGLYGHWELIDDLQEKHEYFWMDFAFGYWVLTEPRIDPGGIPAPRTVLQLGRGGLRAGPEVHLHPDQHRPAGAHQVPPHPQPSLFAAVQRLSDPTEQFCRAIIGRFLADGSCDFIADFASVFPTMVFMRSLGLPVEDTPVFVAHVATILANLRDPAMADELAAALQAIRDYFQDALEDRSRDPRDPEGDFLSYLLASEKDGSPLSNEEILNICQVLAMAGLETTAGQLGFMFHHMATHPEEQRRIVEDPSVIDRAVEEFRGPTPSSCPDAR